MDSEFPSEGRNNLVNALSDLPQFRSVREREAFIRAALSGYPFSDEARRTLRWLDWEGAAFVVADELVRLLELQEIAPGVPALRVIAQAIRPPARGPVAINASAADRTALKEYDVFLCHNSKDKPAVLRIANMLVGKGLLPWLDVWDLRPGMRWQPEIERQIDTIKSAAVFVGSSGLGPWQDEESYAILSRFRKLNRPAIPVILEDAPDGIELPAFLDARTRVDFRKSEPDPLNHLIFGITGKNPALPYSR
jgi:hypothetical protein